jgi:hypothetical protein
MCIHKLTQVKKSKRTVPQRLDEVPMEPSKKAKTEQAAGKILRGKIVLLYALCKYTAQLTLENMLTGTQSKFDPKKKYTFKLGSGGSGRGRDVGGRVCCNAPRALFKDGAEHRTDRYMH